MLTIMLTAMAHDKKRVDDGLRFVLPVAAGDVRILADVPTSQVLDRLNPLLEDNGVLLVNECGLVDGNSCTIFFSCPFRPADMLWFCVPTDSCF